MQFVKVNRETYCKCELAAICVDTDWRQFAKARCESLPWMRFKLGSTWVCSSTPHSAGIYVCMRAGYPNCIIFQTLAPFYFSSQLYTRVCKLARTFTERRARRSKRLSRWVRWNWSVSSSNGRVSQACRIPPSVVVTHSNSANATCSNVGCLWGKRVHGDYHWTIPPVAPVFETCSYFKNCVRSNRTFWSSNHHHRMQVLFPNSSF